MAQGRQRLAPGSPQPLGATWDGRGVNFALFSANAEKVELCLFDSGSQRERERVELVERTGDVWHGYLPEGCPGMLYGYRVYGAYDPRAGHRFNHHKLLLDPYARALTGQLRWSDANFGYRIGSPRGDLSFDRRDNARAVPKCVVVDPAFGWGGDRRLRTPWPETVLYEVHLKGYTMRHPGVPEALRGTAAGFASEVAVEHLVRLGVSAVELLPVQAALNPRWLAEQGRSNYWGYATIGFFAPDPRFLGGGGPEEFRRMVARLHAAGIEVILDVVYNHTGEGNHLGPTLVFRGIDNASYYRLQEKPYFYDDLTGTGNTLKLAHPAVLRMVLDSLRMWVEEYHVDGFRFDLATTLAREDHEFDSGAGFLDALRQDPVLADTKLIAEPWDLGPRGYRLGQFGAPFAEWNDRYRDDARRFWRGDPDALSPLGRRLTGSADIFETSRRRPWASINFVTCHDGFTLADLVSYAAKHNEANGEDNKDGSNENFSANYGVEGETDDDGIRALRRRQRRNLLAMLLLSQGTPMLLGGDEFGRSQGGNNNAWCQDNELSWFDWHGLREEAEADIDYVAHLLALRRRHPALRAPHYLHGQRSDAAGLADILWFGADGSPFKHDDWHRADAATVGMLLNGGMGVYSDERGGGVYDGCLFLVLHRGAEAIEFVPPGLDSRTRWRRLLDTAADPPWREELIAEAPMTMAGRSLVLLERLSAEGG